MLLDELSKIGSYFKTTGDRTDSYHGNRNSQWHRKHSLGDIENQPRLVTLTVNSPPVVSHSVFPHAHTHTHMHTHTTTATTVQHRYRSMINIHDDSARRAGLWDTSREKQLIDELMETRRELNRLKRAQSHDDLLHQRQRTSYETSWAGRGRGGRMQRMNSDYQNWSVATPAPLLPGTPASRHPCTPAPRHPCTPAPLHSGTLALRHSGRLGCHAAAVKRCSLQVLEENMHPL